MTISENDPNSTPKTFNNLDWTAAAATAIPTALSFYAFNAAANAKSTPSMLFHAIIGVFSLKYSYGFASAWRENGSTTNKAEYISRSLHNADNIQKDSLDAVYSLYNSIIPSKKKTTQVSMAAVGLKVLGEIKDKKDSSPNT